MENKLSGTQRIISYLTIILRVVIIILIVILLHAIYKGLKQDGYIIQAIQTPRSFAESGYNGIVIANKLQDKVKQIKDSANSSRQDSLVISANSSSDLKMDVMGIGVSSTSLIYHLRDLLRIETKTIRGDLIDLDNELSMTIRVHGFPVKTFSESYVEKYRSQSFEKLITTVAEHILSCTDPYYQVINLYRGKRYTEAKDLIREMINNRPGEAKWGYLAWGNMTIQQGDDEKSTDYFLKSIELDTDFFMANKNIAWRYFTDEEYEQAIMHFERALKSRPDDYESINGIAMAYRELAEVDKSESYYKLNLDRNPDLIWSYMAYADFYTMVKKDTQQAISIFNEAKSHVTQNDDFYLTQAGYYFFQNKMDSALMYIDKSLDFNPNNISALQQISTYLTSSRINNPKEAVEYQRRLVKAQEKAGYGKWNRIRSYNSLAMTEWRLSEFDSAFIHIQRAIDIDPDHALPYTTLAEIHFAMNNRKAFYDNMQHAFDLGLEFRESWYEDEPYKSLKNDFRLSDMIAKSEQEQQSKKVTLKN